jgi:hypothetical protein
LTRVEPSVLWRWRTSSRSKMLIAELSAWQHAPCRPWYTVHCRVALASYR